MVHTWAIRIAISAPLIRPRPVWRTMATEVLAALEDLLGVDAECLEAVEP
jgi:hypothetical protein